LSVKNTLGAAIRGPLTNNQQLMQPTRRSFPVELCASRQRTGAMPSIDRLQCRALFWY
jgi:hypothetical protein